MPVGGKAKSMIHRLAPAAAAALLALILGTGQVGGPSPVQADAYFASVREAMEAVPYRIGSWIGVDAPPIEAAVKLLKPNKILQRRYEDPATGRSVSLLIVHCANTQDMLGHYPPVCYKANGWTQARADEASVTVGAAACRATRYEFIRLARNAEHEVTILSFFVLPDGRVAPDMGTLEQASERKWQRALGAAQVQIVYPAGMTDDERAQVEAMFVRAIEPTIRVIAGGVDA